MLQSPKICCDLLKCFISFTREEKILFEKYGEDYDDIVGQMSRSEKMRLKQEVGHMEAKDPEELLQHTLQTSNVSATTSTHSFVKAVVREETVEEEEETAQLDQLESPPFRPEESIFMAPAAGTTSTSNQYLGDEVKAAKSKVFSTPTFSRIAQGSAVASGGKTMPNYLRPTQSSRLKASPSKAESPFLSAGGGGRLFAHPLGGGSSGAFRSADCSPAPGRLFAHPSLTPQSSSKLPFRRVAASGIDMKSIDAL